MLKKNVDDDWIKAIIRKSRVINNNNNWIETINQKKLCSNNEAVNQEELCNNNDKTEDKSDFFSNTNNKKRKFGKFDNFNHVLYQFYVNLYSIVFILDVKINEEICDNFYYKLLPTMFKISKSIQRSCDYWKKSYMLGYEN